MIKKESNSNKLPINFDNKKMNYFEKSRELKF